MKNLFRFFIFLAPFWSSYGFSQFVTLPRQISTGGTVTGPINTTTGMVGSITCPYNISGTVIEFAFYSYPQCLGQDLEVSFYQESCDGTSTLQQVPPAQVQYGNGILSPCTYSLTNFPITNTSNAFQFSVTNNYPGTVLLLGHFICHYPSGSPVSISGGEFCDSVLEEQDTRALTSQSWQGKNNFPNTYSQGSRIVRNKKFYLVDFLGKRVSRGEYSKSIMAPTTPGTYLIVYQDNTFPSERIVVF